MSSPDARRFPSPLAVWAGLRVLTIAVAALAFASHPPTPDQPHERTPVPDRVAERVVVAPWYSYDAVWYVKIVRDGYAPSDGTTNFHPLYPWVARVVLPPSAHPLWSLLLVSTIAGGLVTIMFQRLAALDLAPDRARAATYLFLCWPATFVIFAPYTEALWLLLAVTAFYGARTGRWWIAGLAGGLASMTRQQGLLLLVPLCIEALMTGAFGRSARYPWERWVALSCVPLGYAAWVGIRALLVGDFGPSFRSPNDFLFSVMISPASRSVIGDAAFLPPWEAIGKAARYLQHGGHPSAWLDAILAAGFLAMLAVAWSRLRSSDRIYSALVTVVSLSFHTGEVSPYMALPRHLLLAFPVFIGFAAAYRFRHPLVAVVAGITAQATLVCAFVWMIWIP
ncbi:MAG TPA: mannosyltransferase family protein [Vicinamibacterales bacterium]|nr:mannosyltransferase family protein [Vicinamibacterales bacterium]